MAEFKDQIEHNTRVTAELLDQMKEHYYSNGDPILPGDTVLFGSEWKDKQLQLVKFKESHIGTVLEIIDEQQYVPGIKWIKK